MCDSVESIPDDSEVYGRLNVGDKFFIVKGDATMSDISHGRLKFF